MTTTSKTWFSTKHPNLHRHKSGTYYARLTIGSRRLGEALKTAILSVALPRLKELLDETEHRKEIGVAAEEVEKMTGADAIALWRKEIESNARTKASTVRYWGEILAALQKSWKDFASTPKRRITAEQCQNWAMKHKEAMSPTRFNNSVSALKSLFGVAIKKGVRRTNPAADLKRNRVSHKDLSSLLPSRQEFQNLVAAIRGAGGRFSKACADFVGFLAYNTGMPPVRPSKSFGNIAISHRSHSRDRRP